MTVIALRHNYTPTSPVLTWWAEWHKQTGQQVGRVIPGDKLGLCHASSQMKIWAFAGGQPTWDSFAAWATAHGSASLPKAPQVHLYTDTSDFTVKGVCYRLVLEPLVMERPQAVKYALHYWQTDLETLFFDCVDI